MSGMRRRPVFGRPDPFCFFAVLHAALVAVLMAALGLWLLGSASLASAVLVLLFDSWVNRPRRTVSARRCR